MNLVFDIGIMDCDVTNENRFVCNEWLAMLSRCYCEYTGFEDVVNEHSVCDDWKAFSNFYRWYCDNKVDGCEFSIINDSKVYSPNNCGFTKKACGSMRAKKSGNF